MGEHSMTKYGLLGVTGAGGFIGQALADAAAVRQRACRLFSGKVLADGRFFSAPALDNVAAWAEGFKGVGTVVHLLGRAHVLREVASDPLAQFRQVNVEATRVVLQACRQSGVRRFVFVSSIGVCGGFAAAPLTEESPLSPQEPYSQSKAEAEALVKDACEEAGIEWVIVRPPLVYGPGCPGNLRRLMQLIATGIPLPLGRVDNLRSMVGASNLADFLLTAASHPAAANQAFVISDNEDVSTSEVVRLLASGMGRPARLLNLPYFALLGGAKLAGQGGLVRKLCDTLRVDSSKAQALLGWEPAISVVEGLRLTGWAFSNERRPVVARAE